MVLPVFSLKGDSMLNHQNYKLAAGGAGMIAFTRLPNGTINVLLSRRDKSVGEGLGITGGGFLNLDAFTSQPAGAILPLTHEAYREAVEENPGFENVITDNMFEKRAFHLTSFAVRTSDQHGVHVVCYYGLELDENEFSQVKALPPSEERVGDLIATNLSWRQESLANKNPLDRFDMHGKENFYHQHELYAFSALAENLACAM